MESQGVRLFVGRLAIGLLQGIALYILYSAFEDKTWLAHNGLVFAPLLLVSLFIPLLIAQALGNLRSLTLILWALLAATVVAGFAAYDIWHGWPTQWQWKENAELPRILPAFGTFFFSAAFLFIGHALVMAGDTDRKVMARYHTDFDVAWKQGLQYALAAAFVGIFWALLWLGAALFKLINLDFLEKLIEHRWFSIPITTLAIAAALHITDVRAQLVRGARSLVLALFSWLLLLIVVIAAGFLGSLFGTGLAPLWKTRMATSLLLIAAAAIIVLINAAYQDGDEERKPVRILRLAGSLGGLLLLPIVALAGYAVYLRITQYGWTADRISATASVVVATAYALGYAVSALLPGGWLKFVERWNFVTSLLVLAVIAALFSPLIDPMRIGVASQVARLETGKIAPEKFDFRYLRNEGGRFGKEALERLIKSKNDFTRDAAQEALKSWNRFNPVELPVTPKSIQKLVHIYPAGKGLPSSFVKEDWSVVFGGTNVPNCLSNRVSTDNHCIALLADIDGDKQDEVIIFLPSDQVSDKEWNAVLLKFDGQHWRQLGDIGSQQHCKGDYASLLAGKFQPVPAENVPPDFLVNGHRVYSNRATKTPTCQ